MQQPELQSAKTPPPFVSQKDNFWDVNANTKSNHLPNHFQISDSAPNFTYMMSQTKQHKFVGQSKATFPTIVFQGKQEHPMLTYFGSTGNSKFGESISELGGIRNMLQKSDGFESSLMDQRRKMYEESFKKYSNFVDRPSLQKTNTRNAFVQPPKQEVATQKKNPFLPRHLQ